MKPIRVSPGRLLSVPLILSFLLLPTCLIFYGTPDFDIPDQTVGPGATLELSLLDYYQDKPHRESPSFSLEAGSVGEISQTTYRWTRPPGDEQEYLVTIWGSNGLTEDSAVFTIR